MVANVTTHPVAGVRAQKGLSQRALAEAIGLKRWQLNRVEHGGRALQISELVSIARVCRLTDEQAMALARALVASEDGDALARDAA